MTTPPEATLQVTALHALHRELGAKMVPFAGYDMPVQYPAGILKEHLHTRESAGLFDVSHMGQAILDAEDAAAALERLVPGDLAALAPGQIRYTVLTNDEGGILDDLMIARPEDGSKRRLNLIVNAACKAQDFAHIEARLKGVARLFPLPRHALIALQGPLAAAVMARLVPGIESMRFMTQRATSIDGLAAQISRSGYTGEDGFEISVPEFAAEALARRLLAEKEVAPIGLGARDSLRLEAGLCLYGHDIDTTTSPIEAGLAWTISKRRREQGAFPGAARIQRELASGPARRRVGILPDGKAPAREHTEIVDAAATRLGEITSGGFGPSLGGPMAMGYVDSGAAAEGTALHLMVRGSPRPARVVKLPFVPHRYHRG